MAEASVMDLAVRRKLEESEAARTKELSKQVQADLGAGAASIAKKHKALDFLLQQSKLFSNIMLERIQNDERLDAKKAAQNKQKSDETSSDLKARGRSKKSAQSEKSNISSYFSKAYLQSKTKSATVQGAIQATIEDSVKASSDGVEVLKSARQPSLVTGGTMRKYQLEGLEWLKSLYENGLNGILADEMGLGKTIQTISFLAFLREMGIYGPFLAVAPLSTLTNWVNEFKKWAPDVPVILYHGTRDERAVIRASHLKNPQSDTFPVLVTNYEVLMNDEKFLGKYVWEYIIIDEGHRIKNVDCRLVKNLMDLRSNNRLLLTGTPLQNNLSELWSLLHFLMPDIFKEYKSFESWFDFSALKDKDQYDQIFNREREEGLITTLHAILKPFLLRRVKADVEKSMPKKREYVLFAPLTKAQRDLYQALLDGTARAYLEQTIIALHSMTDDVSCPSITTSCVSAAGFKRKFRDFSTGACSTPTKTPKSTRDSTPASSVVGKRTTRKSYAAISDREYFEALDRSRSVSPGRTTGSSDSDASVSCDSVAVFAKKQVALKKLQNPAMQLRLCCNSPYNFYNPYLLPDGTQLDPDESLVTSSGKMKVLDVLLPRLFQDGHKVLIFSQFKTQLDLIHTFASMRGWKCCRIDGGTAQVDRAAEIQSFDDRSGGHNMFLLSTRAGGVGINLTAADTVILFDSDWNPQQDLQAQDRAHRIGQKNNVIVYRLATRNTIEEQLLDKAQYKRRLEKLSIQKGGLQAVNKKEGIDIEELKRKLAEADGEVFDVQDNKAVISKRDLDILTDRTDEAYARAEQGEDVGDAFKSLDARRGGGSLLETFAA